MYELREIFKTKLKKFTEQKKINRRLWNISDETAEILFKLVLLNKPRHILEIGTSNGYSTFWLSLAAERTGSIIHTIEVDEVRFRMACENLSERQNVNLIYGLAEEEIPKIDQKFDFVFIDGGKIGYINYIRLLENKLEPKAVIIADNVISHKDTVRDYLDFMQENELFETETIDIGSGLEISKYNLKNKKENKCQHQLS